MAGEGSSDQSVSGFSEAQRSESIEIVSAAIQIHHRNYVRDQPQRKPPRYTNFKPDAASAIVTRELSPEELGFLDPEYEGSSCQRRKGYFLLRRIIEKG